ncbi:MAG: hypothetical protein HUU37_02655 [Bdellovibrionales bacterium]|nr:hypothetical protein [Bdellovibrionales bacterium]
MCETRVILTTLAGAEDLRWQHDAGVFQPIHELRAQACRADAADESAVEIRVSKSKLFLFFVALTALAGCKASSPVAAVRHVNEKAREMMEYEARYKALRAEHEKLRAEFFRLEHRHMALLAETRSVKTAEMNLESTGSKAGRRPSQISYKVPALDAEGLYALAFDHVRERRIPEAAATFEALLQSPEMAATQSATAYYTAGVVWYELENYRKAEKYFDLALERSDSEERAKFKSRIELWKRAVNLKQQRMPASVPSSHPRTVEHGH